ALYLHQGESFVVDELDLEDGLALCHPESPEWTTSAREQVSIDLVETLETVEAGPVTLSWAEVEVTTRVTGYQRRLRGARPPTARRWTCRRRRSPPARSCTRSRHSC